LDLGQRRIGVAVSDPLGITAQGLETMQRRNRRTDMEALKKLLAEHGVTRIIVGLPLHLSGRAGARAEEAQAFAARLERETGIAVELFDERLTTAEALRALRETGAGLAQRRAAVDRMAATILLQSYLDAAGAQR
jgi:putative Holliday junction resolvase